MNGISFLSSSNIQWIIIFVISNKSVNNVNIHLWPDPAVPLLDDYWEQWRHMSKQSIIQNALSRDKQTVETIQTVINC